jgi:AraC-like DNA-binding protein
MAGQSVPGHYTILHEADAETILQQFWARMSLASLHDRTRMCHPISRKVRCRLIFIVFPSSLLLIVCLLSVWQVLEASKERPYLSLRLELAPALVGSVMVEAGYSSPRDHADVRAIAVSPLDVHLLDAIVRLTRLLDSPADAPVLLPLITREIIYRLLMGEQGTRLRHLAIQGGYTPHIARAVGRLRRDFDQPLRIERLARELGMSVSGFHHHFKAVTTMSPLQFQKRLRLQEARRLMLSEDLDAASAAYRVGYHDASHFNREYKSLFGVPPMRDVQRLREAAVVDSQNKRELTTLMP